MLIFALALAAVGVIDNGMPSDASVTVTQVSAKSTDYKHGDLVLKAIKENAPNVKVYYASPFERDPDATRPNEVIIDWQIAYKAMIEMKKAGVKYVCTSFSTSDEKGAKDFKFVADQLGLTIVASLGNDKSEGIYPAALPGVVAVLGTEQTTKVSHAARNRADFVVSGDMGNGVRGSSFASARVCGKLAHMGG